MASADLALPGAWMWSRAFANVARTLSADRTLAQNAPDEPIARRPNLSFPAYRVSERA
jgi:hypothetical protein